MPRTIEVFSDYVCPFCMLSEHIIREATTDLDVDVVWRPFELRPEPVPTLRPEDPYLPAIWRRSVYPMAKSLGVPITLPSISPQPRSDTAFRGFVIADEQGRGDAYSQAVFHAFFVDDQDIGDPEVLTAAAAAAGIDPVTFRRDLDAGRGTHEHQQALVRARDLNITVVPTMIIGATRINGVPQREQLRAALGVALTARHAPQTPTEE